MGQEPILHASMERSRGTELNATCSALLIFASCCFWTRAAQDEAQRNDLQDAPFLVLDGLAIRRASTLLSCQ